MKLSVIVAHLRAYCPAFGGRVAAGIDWDAVASSSKLQHPSAYVIASGDDAEPNQQQNVIRQVIADGFDVVVVLDSSDERGQEANDELHDVRAEIWRALVGWEPGSEYEPITYDGGSLVHISRARVVYRFSFVAEFQLGRSRRTDPAETWQELQLDGLPAFRGADVDMDPIDPKDSSHSAPGPDGRVDVRFSIDPSQE